MAKKRIKAKIRKEARFFNATNLICLESIGLAITIIVIFILNAMNVISFKTTDLGSLDLVDEALLGGQTSESLDYLPEGYMDGENTTMFTYEMSTTDSLYFRSKSYGDYNGSSFNEGAEYDNTGRTYRPLDFTAIRAREAGVSPVEISIHLEADQRDLALVPQYTIGSDYFHVTSDSYYDVGSWDYSAVSYPSDNCDISSWGESSDETFLREEAAYRSFAYENYLALDEDIAETLREWAIDQGIDETSSTLRDDLTKLVASSCQYDLKYNLTGCPSRMDKTVYFLTVYQRGICMQFARATTLLLRSFGIPARYTTGYHETDGFGSIGRLEAHAWCEAYEDGIGWLIQESALIAVFNIPEGTISGGVDGSIGAGPSTAPSTTPVAAYTTDGSNFDKSEPIYFRYQSYGDYDYSTSSWLDAPILSANNNVSPSMWTGMKQSFLYPDDFYNIGVMQLSGYFDYCLVPAYSTWISYDGKDEGVIYNDSAIPAEGNTTNYEFSSGIYAVETYGYAAANYTVNADVLDAHGNYFLENGDEIASYISGEDSPFREQLSQSEYGADADLSAFTGFGDATYYQEQVLNGENFSSIPEGLQEVVREFCDRMNLNYTSGDLSLDQLQYVNSLISSQATSVYHSNTLLDGVDPIAHVLDIDTTGKEANATMLASAEVMVLRELGMKARYVSGFISNPSEATANETPDLGDNTYLIYASDSYGWVEVYIEGVGWLKLDPTGDVVAMDDEDSYYSKPGSEDQGAISLTPSISYSDLFIYDGEEHYLPQTPVLGLTNSSSGLASCDVAIFEPTEASYQIDAGTYEQVYTVTVYALPFGESEVPDDLSGLDDVTSGYKLSNSYASMRIRQRPLYIPILPYSESADTSRYTYDYLWSYLPSAYQDSSISGLVLNHECELSDWDVPEVDENGDLRYNPTVTIYDPDTGEDVTKNYSPTFIYIDSVTQE